MKIPTVEFTLYLFIYCWYYQIEFTLYLFIYCWYYQIEFTLYLFIDEIIKLKSLLQTKKVELWLVSAIFQLYLYQVQVGFSLLGTMISISNISTLFVSSTSGFFITWHFDSSSLKEKCRQHLHLRLFWG